LFYKTNVLTDMNKYVLPVSFLQIYSYTHAKVGGE